MAGEIFSDDDVSFLISVLADLWEGVTVWCEVECVLLKVMFFLLSFSRVLPILAVLLTIGLPVLVLQVVFLLGAAVGYFVPDDPLCVLVDLGSTDCPFWIIGFFL